jgi:hypothetical protein
MVNTGNPVGSAPEIPRSDVRGHINDTTPDKKFQFCHPSICVRTEGLFAHLTPKERSWRKQIGLRFFARSLGERVARSAGVSFLLEKKLQIFSQ